MDCLKKMLVRTLAILIAVTAVLFYGLTVNAVSLADGGDCSSASDGKKMLIGLRVYLAASLLYRRCELAISRLFAYLKHISHRQTGKVSGKSFIFSKNFLSVRVKRVIYAQKVNSHKAD